MIADTQSQDEIIEKTKANKSKKLIPVVVITLVLFYLFQPAISQWYSSVPTIELNSLTISEVTRGALIREVTVSGKAVAANAPQLYSTEVGKISLLAKPGEHVEKNQVVARLTSPELASLIKQQKSTLEQLNINASRGVLEDKEAQLDLESKMNSAQSALNVAKRERQRAEISFGKNIISEVDWLKSHDTLTDAELFYQHAKKRVELAKERLSFETKHREFLIKKQQLILDELLRRFNALDIRAPVAGVVGNWLVAQKNSISANTAIMTIVDLSKYEAELNVPEFYADDLGLGLTVSMNISGHKLIGKIVAISPEIKGSQVQVRAELNASKKLQLRQNQRISARIEFEKKNDVLMVKRGAFLASLGGKQAFLLDGENSAKIIPINTGITSVDFVEITTGVEVGDKIIVSDYQKYVTARKINITD